MVKKFKDIDIRLQRDPRYVAAEAKLTELKITLNDLERAKDAELAILNGTTSYKKRQSPIEFAAQQMIYTGAMVAIPESADIVSRKKYEELSDKVSVLRLAVQMQRDAIARLRAEISEKICRELLPLHIKNVKGIVDALLVLNEALEQESDLRASCVHEDVWRDHIIRSMSVPALGLLRDENSRISRYMREAVEFGFVDAADMPEAVRKHLPKKANPVTRLVQKLKDNDGWVGA